MQKVEKGLYVSVHYKGTLDNGDVFDSSEGRMPLEVQMGAGQLIKGFEAALDDMVLNEKKTFTLTPEEAYGLRDDKRMHHFPRNEVPPEMEPQVGQAIALTSPDGRQIPARIAAVDDQQITVDLNHPLAGQALTFDIEVVGISPTATQEHAGCGGGCGGGCHDDKSGCGCAE
ncbi:MAG: peptidylprolyl isomerase [Desulfobacterales bacterium]|nr:peptidylprolyl isomerase [Desulfobacterales bacterium]